MTTPLNSWENTKLNNSNAITSMSSGPANPAIPQIGNTTTRPALPPRPLQNSYGVGNYNSYNSSYGGGYGGYGSYGSSPYRSSLLSTPYGGYNSYGYGGYNSLGGIGSYSGFGPSGFGTPGFGAEDRFIQYAEERSRDTFSSIENIVRAFSSISMMLDNTFFAMSSSFRAVLSVAENFGRLRSVFGQIWYSVNIFRLFTWLYRKLQQLLGLKVGNSAKSLAWNEAVSDAIAESNANNSGTSWSVLAFLGLIVSAPYIISKFLPKYEDKCNPENWSSSGVRAKAVFDFVATSPNEMTINTNDDIILAPKHIQEEMRLYNTGWALAACNGRSGVIPLNYIVVVKNINRHNPPQNYNFSTDLPVPPSSTHKTKRVSFGKNQIYELKNPLEEKRPDDAQPEIKPTEIVDNTHLSDLKETSTSRNIT